MVRTKVGENRPVEKRREGPRETSGEERERTIERGEESSGIGIIQDREVGRDEPGEDIISTRVRSRMIIPGGMVCIDVTKDESRRRRKKARRRKGRGARVIGRGADRR